ncbi:MAG: NADH-quinone oxidoreductase subunit N [Anaerolineaceae bacterium]|nr:NADH-quinone oxidoreductase subunit N [Anaerolineaceae bacterium]
MTGEIVKMFLLILPEIFLVVLAAINLGLDLVWRDARCRKLGWLTAAGLLIAIVLSLIFTYPGEEAQLIWGGMLRVDWVSFVFRLVFLAGALVTVLQAMESPALCDRGEFYTLLLISTLGMILMASSADLVMLYLAIETTAIPLYLMAGFRINDQKSVEAGIKYFLYGAMTSAVMLYGFSLLFGFTGSTELYTIAEIIRGGGNSLALLMLALLMVLVGFGFKISIAPFHFWAPDVYEGAPTPVAGFLSTASKAAGFVVLMRILFTVFSDITPVWTLLLTVLSIASMLVGNLLALVQKNIKRLLAYSSIAQAGYILIGVAANSAPGTSGATYYLIAYLATNLAAFGIISIINRTVGSDELARYAGLSRRSPGLALGLLAAMLSLGGIPPFAGFIAKLLVLGAAIQANLLVLAVAGVLNSVLGLYYYLMVLKVVYMHRSEEEDKPLPVQFSRKMALGLCIAAILAMGVFFNPLLGWTAKAGSVFVLLGY